MKKNKNIVATILLILALAAAIIIASQVYYKKEIKSCFTILEEYTIQLAGEMKQALDRDQANLKLLADLLGELETDKLEYEFRQLPLFQTSGIFNEIELFLPENRLLKQDGRELLLQGELSFEEEAKLEGHISALIEDPWNPGKKVLRSYVPVRKNGEISALLCGIIETDRMDEGYSIHAFGGTVQLYVIDGDSGNFIINTWHNSLGNIENWENHKVKSGYSREQWRSDLKEGKRGSIVSFSESSGEYFYCCYEPVGINRWLLMLSVPESSVFLQVRQTIQISTYLAVAIGGIMLIYFVWNLITVRKDSYEKEVQLGRVQYMFEVEKLLFNVHRKPEQMEKALGLIAETSKAKGAFLLLCEKGRIVKSYLWNQEEESLEFDWEDQNISLGILEFLDTFQGGKSLVINKMEWLKQKKPQVGEVFEKFGIQNIIITPVLQIEGHFQGMIGVYNMEHEWNSASQLECVSLTFSMALTNIQTYEKIRTMGMMDSLTELRNRNSYHMDLIGIEKETMESFACIYIDANGLHELNNCLGHEAGDEMLKYIAAQLKEQFGETLTYRIGGDEFIALCKNTPRKEVLKKAGAVRKETKAKNYEISIGIEWRQNDLNISEIIQAAEEKMQQDKRDFYEKEGNVRKLREMNQQLEQMLIQKKDAETLLSVISSNYKGVYFVDLNKDTSRHLYIPEYFEIMLKETKGKFSEALLLYMKEEVKPEYHQDFQKFCDYQMLETELETVVPELTYQKLDETWFRLRVFKFKKYTEYNRETLWIFERK